MTAKERYLYHQIHPAKLVADAAAGFASVFALLAHHLFAGIAIALVVPAAASFLVLRYADLERQKRSSFGAYVKRFMTRGAAIQRTAGFAVLAYGAWTSSFLTGVLGCALIVHAWTMGLLIPRDLRK
ncbi:MAG TPA: hypothetical protein VLC10_04570 [Patescibacteria group bacterium]|nr:hypothetical protein [Patescibacteria group bacterium]